MANQGYKFQKSLSIDELMDAPNIAALLDPKDVSYIGNCVKQGFDEDLVSRADWEKRNAKAMELALQVMTTKSFPWTGSSNVKFPLITVAALQYQAKAYPTLIDESDLVKCKVYGPDPTGEKNERAARISAHMTWQNVEQVDDWEENHDKALLIQAIVGNCFLKDLFHPPTQKIQNQLVSPKNFVVNYFTQDLKSARRYTHTYELSDNDIRQAEIDGRFVPPIYPQGQTTDPSYKGTDYSQGAQANKENPPQTELTSEKDRRQGLYAPPVSKVTPWMTGEMYCWWDLDGDGYEEPYIVTFQLNTGAVRRIVARYLPSGIKRYDNEVYEIAPVEMFTKLSFVPSPDGGFYDLGLGALLGPINESVNTAINQIFDAGTMSTLGGGFVGRGFKNRGGPFTFRPYEWYPVDAPGDDLRKNILPLPVKEPSSVLFQLALWLVGYGERIASANDIQMGESPGQNTPAETTRTLNENGQRVYTAIYKRTWRAFRDEYRIQFNLNKYFLPAQEHYEVLTTGAAAMITKDDYKGDGIDVRPAADPYVASDTINQQKADKLLQFAYNMQGANRYQAGKRWLKAHKYQDIESIYPQPMTQGPDGKPVPAPDFPPPPNPKMMEIELKGKAQNLKEMEFQASQLEFKIEIMLEIQKTTAEINELNARAEKELAEAGASRADPAIKLIYAQIESAGRWQNFMLGLVDKITKVMEKKDGKSGDSAGGNGGAGMAALETGLTNAALLGTSAPVRPDGAGALADGGVSLQ